MRIPNPDINIMLIAIVRNTVNVCAWEKIIEQELTLSACLLEACLPSS